MPEKSNLLRGLRKDIIDNFELAIVVLSVIAYYLLRIGITSLYAAIIAIFLGIFGLYLYVYNTKARSAIKRLGDTR